MADSRNPSADRMCATNSVAVADKQAYMDEAYTALATVYDNYNSGSLIPLAAMAKKKCMEIIAPEPGVAFLDMACGTGDAAKCFFEYQDEVNHDSSSTVTLVDLNDAMLQVSQKRLGDTQWANDGRVEFMHGNAEHIPEIPDSSFDIYCCYLGMHNMPNRDKALKEAMRILKPGGKIYIMDFNTGVWWIGKIARRLVLQLVLYLITSSKGDRAMSLRLNQSGMGFPSPPDFVQEMKNAGFLVEGQGYTTLAFGIGVVFMGTKLTELI